MAKTSPPTPDKTSPGGPPPGAADGKPDGPPSAVAVLTDIGMAYELWHDAAGRAYATDGRHSFPVASAAFRERLALEYFRRTDRAAGREAVATAVNTLTAVAKHDRPCREAAVRLADAAGTVIEVDAAGWRVCDDPPVRFVVPPGMLPMPMPAPGGRVDDLQAFINLPDADAWALLKGWLMAALSSTGPFPLLVRGEQGSANSTTTKVVKRLLDPAKPASRAVPRGEHDLVIAASNGWVVVYHNLSGLTLPLSNTFCRLATGGGFAIRTLYSDSDETIFDVQRPAVLNGITDFVDRDDLLDRAILVRHPRIPPEERRREKELWAAFEAAHPRLLGAVLDRVAGGLRAQAAGPPPADLPRMADFAAWAVACEQGPGSRGGSWRRTRATRGEAREQALATSPVAQAVVRLLDGRDAWAGPAADLLTQLTNLTPLPLPRDWPRAGNSLTGQLRRLAPALRAGRGLEVDCDGRTGGKTNDREVRITRLPGVTAAAPPAGGRSDGSGDQ